MSSSDFGEERVSETLKLEQRVVVSQLMWGLGPERTVSGSDLSFVLPEPTLLGNPAKGSLCYELYRILSTRVCYT